MCAQRGGGEQAAQAAGGALQAEAVGVLRRALRRRLHALQHLRVLTTLLLKLTSYVYLLYKYYSEKMCIFVFLYVLIKLKNHQADFNHSFIIKKLRYP